ncbi:MAG: type III pantothenate kinase [Bacteroidota bacterium]|nr:type III pantothenate kinase [Bacteroidota bacterium]MDX5504894.1 type III pantothenate kinase [Bacteroidota bacterium]
MNLAIDLGNSRVKFGLFSENQLERSFTVDHAPTADDMRELQENFFDPARRVISSSVIQDRFAWLHDLIGDRNHLVVSESIPLPFMMSYKTPHTLGHDRIALAAAAATLFPQQDVLVLDAGTCLTLDFVTSHGVYLGGAISPGLKMRFRALHEGTAGLPLVEFSPHVELTGSTTRDSILSGVVRGMAFEIDGSVSAYQSQYPEVKVVLTGGDASFLGGFLKSTIFARPDFLLSGLNAILKYNE